MLKFRHFFSKMKIANFFFGLTKIYFRPPSGARSARGFLPLWRPPVLCDHKSKTFQVVALSGFTVFWTQTSIWKHIYWCIHIKMGVIFVDFEKAVNYILKWMHFYNKICQITYNCEALRKHEINLMFIFLAYLLIWWNITFLR